MNKTSLNVFLLVFSNDTLLGEWGNGGDVYLVIDKNKNKKLVVRIIISKVFFYYLSEFFLFTSHGFVLIKLCFPHVMSYWLRILFWLFVISSDEVRRLKRTVHEFQREYRIFVQASKNVF